MTKKKRKLIFFWTYLDWGGAQIYMIAIMKLAKADWDILVVLPRASSPEILLFLDQIDIKYDFIENSLDSKPAPSLRRKLERQFNRISTEIETFRYLLRFDLRESVLHIETAPWQSWILLTALRLRRANFFVTLHNALPDKSPAWREIVWKTRMNFVSRLAGFHVFASNNDTKTKFRRYFEEKFWETIKVTYTCINPVEIDAALAKAGDGSALRKKFDIPNDKFIVLCVAQFIDRKGRWNFLDAARIVSESDPDVNFVWLTPKMPTDDETERIAGYGLGDRFRVVVSAAAGQTRDEILQFFRVGDVFAHPSIVDGLPIAILEGMAMGLATISTNVYGIPEAVKPYETGLLVEPENARQLADAILELNANAELRRSLAEQGRQFVIENFDERVASTIAINAYKECFTDGR